MVITYAADRTLREPKAKLQCVSPDLLDFDPTQSAVCAVAK